MTDLTCKCGDPLFSDIWCIECYLREATKARKRALTLLADYSPPGPLAPVNKTRDWWLANVTRLHNLMTPEEVEMVKYDRKIA